MSLDQIKAVLGEPGVSLGLAVTGTSSWRELQRETGITLPADYREFVDAYGPGRLNGYVRVFHPRLGQPPLGEYIEDRAGEWAPVPEVHAVPVPYGVSAGCLMPIALSASGVDLLLWVTDAEPGDWHVCAFAGDVDEFADFGYGFGEWVLRYLDGDDEVKPWFGGSGAVPPSFKSALGEA
jgi:hypothetical protein